VDVDAGGCLVSVSAVDGMERHCGGALGLDGGCVAEKVENVDATR
jgi:hypothetical protein